MDKRQNAAVASLVIGTLIAFTLMAVVGCSGSRQSASSEQSASSSAAPPSYALPDPCSLINQTEVETAAGKGATMKRAHNPRTGDDECRVTGAAGTGLHDIIIIVHRVYQWDAMKKGMLASGTNVKPVAGLGDDGFAGRAIGYNIRKGDKYVQVFGEVTNNDAANEKATHYLVERAVSRL